MTSASVWVLIANPFRIYAPKKKERGRLGKLVHGIFAPSWLLSTLEKLRIPTPRTYHQETRLKWWQWLLSLPSLIVAGVPGYTLGVGIYFLAHFLHQQFGLTLHFDYSHYPTWAKQDLDLFFAQWHYTLAGLLGTLFYARLVFKVYAAELMEALAAEMAAHCHAAQNKGATKKAWLLNSHKLYPVGYRAAFLKAYTNPGRPRRWAGRVLTVVGVYMTLSIPFGYIILTKVATHQWQIPGFH